MKTFPCPNCHQLGTPKGLIAGVTCQVCSGTGVNWWATAEVLEKKLQETEVVLYATERKLRDVQVSLTKQIAHRLIKG